LVKLPRADVETPSTERVRSLRTQQCAESQCQNPVPAVISTDGTDFFET